MGKMSLRVKIEMRPLAESIIRFLKYGKDWRAEFRSIDRSLSKAELWLASWVVARRVYSMGNKRLFEKEGK